MAENTLIQSNFEKSSRKVKVRRKLSKEEFL